MCQMIKLCKIIVKAFIRLLMKGEQEAFCFDIFRSLHKINQVNIKFLLTLLISLYY